MAKKRKTGTNRQGTHLEPEQRFGAIKGLKSVENLWPRMAVYTTLNPCGKPWLRPNRASSLGVLNHKNLGLGTTRTGAKPTMPVKLPGFAFFAKKAQKHNLFERKRAIIYLSPAGSAKRKTGAGRTKMKNLKEAVERNDAKAVAREIAAHLEDLIGPGSRLATRDECWAYTRNLLIRAAAFASESCEEN